MNFNWGKTAILRMTEKKNILPPILCMNGAHLNTPDFLKYLGLHWTANMSWDRHIQIKTDKMKKALILMLPALKNRYLSIKTRLHLIKEKLIPMALYGCELWSLEDSKTSMDKHISPLQQVINEALQKALDLHKKVSRLPLWIETACPPLDILVKAQCYRTFEYWTRYLPPDSLLRYFMDNPDPQRRTCTAHVLNIARQVICLLKHKKVWTSPDENIEYEPGKFRAPTAKEIHNQIRKNANL